MKEFLKCLLVVPIVLGFFVSFGFAQNKADLEVKVDPGSNSARGGEAFSYAVTVSNRGTEKAADVFLNQREPKEGKFRSFVPAKGNCEVNQNRGAVDRMLLCKFGSIAPGESVVILVELKIHEFGDASEIDTKYKLPSIPGLTVGDVSSKNTLSYIDVSANEADENKENNSARLSVQLLPSLNLPPRVEIISPKNETTITRSVEKDVKVVFEIRAFDPDGEIEKVVVNTGQYYISIEYPENKYVIDGKKYSIKEVEENMAAFQQYFGGEAIKVGKDTYSFTLVNPKFGFNDVSVSAYDNGKRTGSASIKFFVKGDYTVALTGPAEDAAIKPGTDVVFETRARMNEGKIEKIELIGNQLCCKPFPLFEFGSKNGSEYLHRYIWKNIPKGLYFLQVILFTETNGFTYSEHLKFKVTEKPRVKITSLKQGQVFNSDQEIPIDLEAVDPDGEIKTVTILTDGNYEKEFSWLPGGNNKRGRIWRLSKGVHKIQAVAVDDLEVGSESEPVTITVN